MSSAGDDQEPAAEVVIRSQRHDDDYRLIGDPEVVPKTGAERLASAMAEAGEAVTDSRKAIGYSGDGLPSGGNSLWWPDRTAQVVQATDVSPDGVGEFLIARSGQPHDRLRIRETVQRSPNQFSAHAQLRVRGGWRGVTLKTYPTPSANLTVIEMLPRRVWMPQTKSYLTAGVPAISELTDEIETGATEHP